MKKKSRRFWGTILLCNLFLTLTVAFFSPMEVILMNISEFYFPFRNIWWFQLLVTVGAALALSLVMVLLPPRAGQIAAAIPLGLGLAAYVQAMLLNGSLETLTGLLLRIPEEQRIINLVIWGVILLAVLLAVILAGHRPARRRLVNRVMTWCASALIIMQTVALVSLVATTDLSGQTQSQYLSVDGEFELSSNQNVIEFVLDTADGTFTREMLEQFPELYDSLAGWTYYPNATSTHSRTYPSITYMLTGEKCFFNLPVEDYVNEAFEKSAFLKGLYQKGTDIRIFTWNPELVAGSAQEYVANSVGYRYNQFENLDLPKLEENLMKIALYKSLPYQFKGQFLYSNIQINTSSYQRPDLFIRDYNHMDPSFGDTFMTYEPLTTTSRYGKAYRFYHLFGAHPGADWDENLEAVDPDEVDVMDPSFRARALRGSFRMIERYIGKMKELGIYDQATIIVTADHGISTTEGPEDTLDRQTTSCPIMMVKLAGSDLTRPMVVDEAPVAHEDLFATIESELGAEVTGTGSGKALKEYTAGEARDRYYYYTVFRKDAEGEIALQEYLVNGDAENIANWHVTGKWWKILYSENLISQIDFAEYQSTAPQE